MQTNSLEVCKKLGLKIKEIDRFETSYGWDSTSLSHGYPGLICLFTELNHFFPNEEWIAARHRCVENLISEIKQKGIHDTSLFRGLGGICFAIEMTGSYPKLLSSLHNQLLKQEISIEMKQPQSYDCISGICGIAPYLLKQKAPTKKMISSLVELTKPINQVPGWFIEAKYCNPGEHFKLGCLDSGIAHGIAGVLIVLAKAFMQGIEVDNHQQAMRTIIAWLQETRLKNKKWIPRREMKEYPDIISEHCRDGWCYGAPGIGLALFYAAHALKNATLYDYAIDTMTNVCERLQQSTPYCPSICHGKGGLLAILHQMYLATKMSIFKQTSEQLCLNILEDYDEKHLFGFKSFAPGSNGDEEIVDSLSIVQGTIGVILSLLFQKSTKSRPWLELFLIN